MITCLFEQDFEPACRKACGFFIVCGFRNTYQQQLQYCHCGEEKVWEISMTGKDSDLRNKLIRSINEVPLQRLLREPLYDSSGVHLTAGTVAEKLGASYNELSPGKQGCPYHLHHAQEEMFVILEGCGTLRVADEKLPIKAGDVIFMPAGPEYPHQIINTSSKLLKYLSISTMELPEICEYPDSGKFMAKSGTESSKPFKVIQHSDQNVNYWEGEP
jgi:uncharacterized cupin superfamily protein